MPLLTLEPVHKQIEVTQGTNLLEAIQQAHLPIARSCGAVAVCAKCFVTVIEGEENLTPPSPLEIKLIQRDNLPPRTRLACLTKIRGPVTISASYW